MHATAQRNTDPTSVVTGSELRPSPIDASGDRIEAAASPPSHPDAGVGRIYSRLTVFFLPFVTLGRFCDQNRRQHRCKQSINQWQWKLFVMEMIVKTDGSMIVKTDGSTTVECDPWNPALPPPPFDCTTKMMLEYSKRIKEILRESRARNIIAPERTPQSVLNDFCLISCRLATILEKDSVRSFLSLFEYNVRRMAWGLIMASQTFNFIVAHNALRCAKVALEGKAPRLSGYRANPNYMTSFGFYPLHQAAEIFSLNMINLLLDYGASANVRTTGNRVIEGLLPLHIAIENTCMHKYLEDNLLTEQKHLEHNDDYIYKLIHLLCLPQMKIFLDTIRLLAKYTDTVVDEVWNYIKDGKLVHTAILLLAAQQQMCSTARSKRNGNFSGIDIIKSRIAESAISLESQGNGLERGKKGKAHKLLKEKKNIFHNASELAVIISQAGEALDAYIQTHSEVPHHEVLRHVSSVLKDHGFSPTGKGIDVGDLYWRHYDYGMSDYDIYKEHGNMDATETAIGPPNLNAQAKKAVGKNLPNGQDHRMYFPYWRSVLRCRFTVKVWPSYVTKTEHMPSTQHLYMAGSSRNTSKDEGSSSIPNYGLGLSRRTPQLASNHQSKRLYGTAALTLLKMLKRA